MNIAWDKVLPVLVAIAIIIVVAVLRNTSRAFAAVAATMPIQIPLTLFVVFSGVDVASPTGRAGLIAFTEGLVIGLFSTLVFTIVIWLAARAGWSLWAMLGGGYAAWAVALFVLTWLRGAAGTR
jgi:hypothetical protein